MNRNLKLHTRNTQKGSTLIEILVSMFILGLGVMAILATQMRTTVGLREAENMSYVTQATQNLAENMLTNPVLELSANGKETIKNYSAYNFNCSGTESRKDLSGSVTKENMVEQHKSEFCSDLKKNVLGLSQQNTSGEVKVQICHKSSPSADPLDYTNMKCGETGNQTIIQVAWIMDAEKEGEVNTYSYELPLSE